jgi:cyclic beta-1,2-glucan synthetase
MNRLISEFSERVHYISNYYRKLIKITSEKQNVGSINEWIVDNYYVIKEQEKYIKNECNDKKIRKIDEKRKKQIYNLIYEYLEKNDFRVDMPHLFKKLNDYQITTDDYFSYYEINLISTSIRMVLILQLDTLSRKLNNKLDEKEEVNKIFNIINSRIINNKTVDFEKYIKISNNIIDEAYYIEELNYRLKEMGKYTENFFIKLNKLLLKNKVTLKDVIKESQDDMTRDNLLMINVFNSLKSVSRYKIEYLYKNISFAEKTLVSENANIYDQMYDNNKDNYRDIIIKLARREGINEYQYALDLVQKANVDNKHIGWYLFKQKNNNSRAKRYAFVIVSLTICLSLLIATYTGIASFFLLLIAVSNLVTEIINQLLLRLSKPSNIFKLKFENGLPPEYSTMVVIPTILKNSEKVDKMFNRLEVYYLSNKTDNLYFTLLGDCSSESVKNVDADKEIIASGLKKVEELNEKYGKKIFYFVYRNRMYNDSEECYLGFERKRGALNHFNKLLLNKLTLSEKEEYFNCHTFTDFNIPIKYVITLDTDTKLVLNTALKLIGAMAHPINKPILSKDRKKVISGYGIMQPRISIDVEVTNKSQYSQLFAGLGGLDIYTTACFDLYQDVFGEGSFVGKGIYDLAVFDEVLADSFPNNLILSHDLLEGNYLRCGFINDVELFDDYPSSYLNDASRHHRWTRGDWQIIGWLRKKVRNLKERKVKNPINHLSKWKIFDNLRRSLINVSLLLLIFYGFAFGKEPALFFIVLVSIIICIPILFYLLSRIFNRSKSDVFLKYYLDLVRGIVAVVNKSFIVFAVLPYEAYLYADAIIKSMYRMFISKKRLLNWITAEEVDRTLKNNFETYIRSFKINYLASILLITVTLVYKRDSFVLASIVSIIWMISPIIMYLISRSLKNDEERLNDKEKNELKEIATKTWQYFDDLLVEENNYLIPDNYQFNRDKVVDYKTSPTNIGFSLVSVISANELGLISSKKAIDLISNIIRSVEKLNKWNGHLYNWYDIHDLKEISPFFISSVDNGNFIASLYVVKSFVSKYENDDILYRVTKLIDDMDFTKLYNKSLDVFSLGENVSEQSLLVYNYNKFASESRLTSFIAIAKGDVPYKHWFCLDKTLTKYKCFKGLASWSGTAFEYFMPLIFMKTFGHTLLDETYYFAYYAQREFVKEQDSNLPWGISESAYNELDDSENYKYKAFGIPYLKLQDSSSYPIVISPYSSIMAIEIDDREVYNNIKKLKNLGMYSDYGFYEAYDNEDGAVIKNYYAHHQGMILASLTNYLSNEAIRNYFHDNKEIEAIEMLLKEKVQLKTYINLKMQKYRRYQYSKEIQENDFREYDKLRSVPELGVVSNGHYSVLINDRGVGFSKYKNLQINRYREIATDDYGLFLYVKNVDNNKTWCNTYAPLDSTGSNYKVTFASDRIKYVREDDGIVTNTEITVTKDHNAELRKVTFTNNTNNDVTLEATSYGEVIICRNEEDIAHRAFNNLTISSEIDANTSSLIFSRKSRTKENTRYFLIHHLFLDDDNDYPFEYETSRLNFLGRNNTVSNPEIINENKALTNMVGVSLDPIMSIRKRFKIKAKGKITLYMLVGFGKSREQVMEIVNTYKDKFSVNRAFDMTTVFNNMRNSYANLKATEMRLYNTMLKYIYQTFSPSDNRKETLSHNIKSQSDLWKFGVSGDLPIILVEISKIEDISFIREILQSYEFFKSRALYIDIFIINSEEPKKGKIITNYINSQMYRINSLNYFENSPGGVYIFPISDISEEDRILLETVSRLSLNASNNKTLEEQVNRIAGEIPKPEDVLPIKYINNLAIDIPNDIKLYNSYGGFLKNGEEYYIQNRNTPTPWANVIANDKFGFVISNNFGGFTYAYNSREFKLTSWSNDIVEDPCSEVIVINNYRFKPNYVKHGYGYSIFFSSTEEYDIFIKIFIGVSDTIKFYEITINNKLDQDQTLVFDFASRLILGVTEEQTTRYLSTDFDEDNNCLYVKNAYINNFRNVSVFMSSTEKIVDYNDTLPQTKSITVIIDLKPKESKTFSFILGCEQETKILEKYKDNKKISEAFNQIVNNWDKKLSVIKVNTPDEAFNYALNGWYLYQTYSSRLFAKAGFYQVGGAIGFRDQLQDAMGVIYSDSDFTKKKILEHAKHQFREGDVLHWWHEETGIGSRTRFSDDYLWLVYVTYEYITITGDYSILDEKISFVDGEALSENEQEKGITYHYTPETESLYDHLKLCVSKSLNQFGKHNLPLMGSGDWNDGMNRVGSKGRGESVFVGFFLYDLLEKMATISKNYSDEEFSHLCLERKTSLKQALVSNAWDGAWYLRAYYDNGIPLGSRNNSECQIDLLCQSWAVLTGIPNDKQKDTLFREVESRLVDKENKIITLLTPPFNNTRNNPGYIKDYGVGTRENGGQYTHAALWYIMALLSDNQIDRAYEYYQMINPINRTLTMDDTKKYKVEPYVIAADIYSNIDHAGRGGWTWYTGSASWAYKIGIEQILGFKKRGNILIITPKIKASWDGFGMTYQYFDTEYQIIVNNESHISTGIVEISQDGTKLKSNIIKLENDKKIHKVIVDMKEE